MPQNSQPAISSDILREVVFLQNMRRTGVMLSFIMSPEKIEDESIRMNILSDEAKEKSIRSRIPTATLPKRKYWIDVKSGKLCIYLPNIASTKELHTVVFREVVSNYGLGGLLGADAYRKMCIELYNTMPPKQQDRYRAILGIKTLDANAKSLIGNTFCERTARQMTNADELQFARKRWNVIRSHVLHALNISEDRLPLSWFEFSQCLSSSMASHSSRNEVLLKMSEGGYTDSSFRHRLLSTFSREKEGETLDRGGNIFVDYPSDILVSSSARMHSDPIELPMGALYGYSQYDEYGRYTTAVNPLKKDKHPFDLTNIVNLPSDLRKPLAVFASRHASRPDTSVVLCQTRGPVSMSNEKDVISPGGDMGNFVVPITPRNVFYDREHGRRFSQSGGKRINNIDSVYTKNDFEILRWVSRRRLILYLSPNFYRDWLVPTIVKYNALFEGKKAEIQAQEKAEREYLESKEKIKPAAILQFDSAEDGDRWSLLKLYREYTSLVESATKVVKEFENPKIISQKKVLYSISEDRVLPEGERAVVEELSRFLKKAGFNTYIVDEGDPNLLRDDTGGRRALGYTDGVNLFLSANGAGVGTFFHEYTHVWAAAMMLGHGEEWESIKTLLRTLPEWADIADDPAYASVRDNENDLASEVLASIIGKKADKAYRQGEEAAKNEEDYTIEAADATRRLFYNLGLDARQGITTIGDITARVFSDFVQNRIRNIEREGEVVAVTRSSFDSDYKTVILRTPRGEVPVSGVLPGVLPGDRIAVQGSVMRESAGAYRMYVNAVHAHEPQQRIHNQESFSETGTIVKVVYPKAPASDWCQATVQRADGSFFKMAGFNEGLEQGMQISCSGYWETYEGVPQFRSDNALYVPGEGYKAAVVRYLMDLPGIGEKTAQRLVEQYGRAVLDIMDTRPELLLGDGVNPLSTAQQAQLGNIIERGRELSASRHAILWLMQYGVSTDTARAIDRSFAPNTVRILSENPYRLTSLERFGFLRADEIASRMGVEPTDPHRVASAIHYVLSRAERMEGSSCMHKEALIRSVVKDCLHGDTTMQPQVVRVLNSMAYSEKPSLSIQNGNVYHVYMDEAEQAVADNVNRLQRAREGDRKETDTFLQKADEFIDREQKEAGIIFSQEQRDAIKAPFMNNLVVVTGGPGTGKTSAMKATINALQAAGYDVDDIALCASTGKAAKRLSEQVGMKASTIHRLLKYNPADGSFLLNEHNPVRQRVIVVDESSMIDTKLMASLLRATRTGAKVVFIGDVNQLPPVGAGNPLSDMLTSGTVPYVQLRHIYRQGKDSDIIRVAEEVRDGVMPKLTDYEGDSVEAAVNNGKDFSYIRIREGENESVAKQIHETIVQLATETLPKGGFKADSVAVLSPTKRDEDDASTVNLNKSLHEIYNPDGEPFAITPSREFRIGDKVILTKNMAQDDVFNGDQGVVVSFDREERTIRVDFQGNEVDFDVESSLNLLPAYSITVHKSQGSEYPCVVIPVHKGMSFLLSWQLLYTAVTRGKSKVILIGPESAVQDAVRNMSAIRRNTGLTQRLRQECETVCEPLVPNARVISGVQPTVTESIQVKETQAPNKGTRLGDTMGDTHYGAQTIEEALSALSPREKEIIDFLCGSIKKAGINLHYVPDTQAYKVLPTISESAVLRFTGSNLSRENREVLSRGIANRRILVSNIGIINISDSLPTVPSTEEQRDSLRRDIINETAGVWTLHAGTPEQFFYSVSPSVLTSVLSEGMDGEKTLNDARGLNLAVAKALPEIMSGAFDAEILSAKDAELDNGVLCHRLFGAVEYDGKVYRVELTCAEGEGVFSVEKVAIRGLEQSLVVANEDIDERSVATSASHVACRDFFKDVNALSDTGKSLLEKSGEGKRLAGEAFVNELSASRGHFDGRKYGWVIGNDMFITRDGLNPYTTVRNYTQMWAEAIRIGNPELWQSTVSTVKNSPEWEAIVKEHEFAGKEYSENYLIAEIIARSSSDILNRSMSDSLQGKSASMAQPLLSTSASFWAWTGKNIFDISSFENIEDIGSRVLFDLLSGSQLNRDRAQEQSEAEGKAKDLISLSSGIPEAEYALDGVIHAGIVSELPGEELPGVGPHVVSIDKVSVGQSTMILQGIVESEDGKKKVVTFSPEKFFNTFKNNEVFNCMKSRILGVKEQVYKNAQPYSKRRSTLRKKAEVVIGTTIEKTPVSKKNGEVKSTKPHRS